MMRHFFIFLAWVVMTSCRHESEVQGVNEVVPPILSEPEVSKLGFKTKAIRNVMQSTWDREHFGSASVVEQDVKALKPMVEDAAMFARFTLIRETYDRPDDASNRLKRLLEHDPDVNDKMHAGLVLRKGFLTGSEVWIVTTDAVIFSRSELDRLVKDVEALRLTKDIVTSSSDSL